MATTIQQGLSFEKAAMTIFAEALNILCRKRIERGTANIEKQGMTGIIQRMQGDKLERVRVWARHQEMRRELREVMPQEVIDQYLPDRSFGNGADGEAIEDDLLDVINYACIAIMLQRGHWQAAVDSAMLADLTERIDIWINKPIMLPDLTDDATSVRWVEAPVLGVNRRGIDIG